MKVITLVCSMLITLAAICWLGLQIQPNEFKITNLPQTETEQIPLPEDLPAPVERFYRTIYGDKIPVINSVVITGRGRMRPFGIWLPARFIFVHNTGKDYRHYFEATFFGFPFLKVDEGYIDGESFFESLMGTYYNDPNTNQGANLALWAEGGWFPALWVTDPRTHWLTVDDHTAILYVPFEDGEENFVVRFNPQTGLIDLMEAMRFQAAGDTSKVLWLTNEVKAAGKPAVSYATWLDAGKPWASFTPEEIQINLDVSEYIRRRGN